MVGPGFVWNSISVPPQVWREAATLAGIEDFTKPSFTVWQLPGPLFETVESRMLQVRTRLHAAAADPVERMLAGRDAAEFSRSVATLVWEHQLGPPPRVCSLAHRVRLARRAEAWMRERLGEAVSVPDVCLALRVSRRELEYAFRAAFDTSPRAFLHALRMNAIRRALRFAAAVGGAGSVTDIALDHGVTHLGRFAVEYRRLFGEGPRATLQGR